MPLLLLAGTLGIDGAEYSDFLWRLYQGFTDGGRPAGLRPQKQCLHIDSIINDACALAPSVQDLPSAAANEPDSSREKNRQSRGTREGGAEQRGEGAKKSKKGAEKSGRGAERSEEGAKKKSALIARPKTSGSGQAPPKESRRRTTSARVLERHGRRILGAVTIQAACRRLLALREHSRRAKAAALITRAASRKYGMATQHAFGSSAPRETPVGKEAHDGTYGAAGGMADELRRTAGDGHHGSGRLGFGSSAPRETPVGKEAHDGTYGAAGGMADELRRTAADGHHGFGSGTRSTHSTLAPGPPIHDAHSMPTSDPTRHAWHHSEASSCRCQTSGHSSPSDVGMGREAAAQVSVGAGPLAPLNSPRVPQPMQAHATANGMGSGRLDATFDTAGQTAPSALEDVTVAASATDFYGGASRSFYSIRPWHHHMHIDVGVYAHSGEYRSRRSLEAMATATPQRCYYWGWQYGSLPNMRSATIARPPFARSHQHLVYYVPERPSRPATPLWKAAGSVPLGPSSRQPLRSSRSTPSLSSDSLTSQRPLVPSTPVQKLPSGRPTSSEGKALPPSTRQTESRLRWLPASPSARTSLPGLRPLSPTRRHQTQASMR